MIVLASKWIPDMGAAMAELDFADGEFTGHHLFENTGQGWLLGPLAMFIGVVLLLLIGVAISRWAGADKDR